MANEITHNVVTGLTLYFCAFQQDGDVFLTGGASDEVWGTGGRTAADYDEAMTEEDACGHYKGSMAAGIGAGVYQICVYLQAGANPANSDVALAQGEIYWDGTAEINLSTLETLVTTAQADLDIITGTNGVFLDDGAITEDKFDNTTAFPVAKEDSGDTEIARTGADSDTLETLSDQIDAVQTDVTTIVANTGKVVNVYPASGTTGFITGSAVGYLEDEKL